MPLLVSSARPALSLRGRSCSSTVRLAWATLRLLFTASVLLLAGNAASGEMQTEGLGPWAETPRTVSILFAPGSRDLTAQECAELDKLTLHLSLERDLRLELLAYASGGQGEQEQVDSRRLSLERALAVRRYLVGRGVPRVRTIVRALGQRAPDGGDPDRVDIVSLKPH